jgi:peptidoglycan/LPS O-acetylase OafA/YrhL
MNAPDARGTQGPESDGDLWRVNNFDLIRLLAALQVAVYHSIGFLGLLDAPGVRWVVSVISIFPGVPIFFVISGFLVSRSIERAGSLREYFRNRCLRIFPALWAALVLSIVVIGLDGPAVRLPAAVGDWLQWSVPQLWGAQGSGGPQFVSPFTRPLNPSLWTIPIELEFYLLLPVLYALMPRVSRRGNALLALLLVASGAISIALFHGSRIGALLPGLRIDWLPPMSGQLPPYLWMFLVGVLAQRNWPIVRPYLVNRLRWWLPGYVLLCFVAAKAHLYAGSQNITPLFLLPLAGVVLSGAMSQRGLSDALLRHHDISYGTYLYHMLVLDVLIQLGLIRSLAWAAAGLAISLGLALLSWRYVERPCLARKHRTIRVAIPART